MSSRGQRRSNATHRSVTDPDARLAKKGAGKEAKLSYQASVLLRSRRRRGPVALRSGLAG